MRQVAFSVRSYFSAARRRPFLADRAGAAAVEFAMIMLPFLGMLAAIFETGADYFRTSQIQVTAELVGRTLLTKSVTLGLSNKDFIEKYVCTWQKTGVVQAGTLGRMFNCSNVYVYIYTPSSWSSVGSSSFSIRDPSEKIETPAAGQIVVVRIGYFETPMFPVLSGSAFSGFSVSEGGIVTINGKKGYLLQGIMAFRVEPD